jgi:hypothetical protein
MSALDSVLADLVESDRECAYLTLKREPVETLIEEWLVRGDRIAILCDLLARAKSELALEWARHETHGSLKTSPQPTLQKLNVAVAESASAIAHHRHAVRGQLAARVKQTLRSVTTELKTHVSEALLLGNGELAERLEAERQTVQIVIGTIDATVSRLMKEELVAAGRSEGQNVAPST